jgi:hypothetical protein
VEPDQQQLEQIIMILLQHPNEIVRMATENAILQAQLAALTEQRGSGLGDIRLADPDESRSPDEPEGEDT